jgi:hypothetical protein
VAGTLTRCVAIRVLQHGKMTAVFKLFVGVIVCVGETVGVGVFVLVVVGE